MICAELNIHTRLEEEIFYPACREAIDDEHLMDEAQVEHDAAKLLIADLTEASSDDPFYDAKVKLLSEMIKHHVAEEEQPSEGIFAKAEEHDVDNPSLASELAERKQELQRRAARLRPTRAVSFNLDLRNLMEESMARNSDNDRDRDDRGRFTSDRGGGGGGRGRGGWFGDSEGHSRAARSRDDDDDDRGGRGRSRSRDDDDDDRGGRRPGPGGGVGFPPAGAQTLGVPRGVADPAARAVARFFPPAGASLEMTLELADPATFAVVRAIPSAA